MLGSFDLSSKLVAKVAFESFMRIGGWYCLITALAIRLNSPRIGLCGTAIVWFKNVNLVCMWRDWFHSLYSIVVHPVLEEMAISPIFPNSGGKGTASLFPLISIKISPSANHSVISSPYLSNSRHVTLLHCYNCCQRNKVSEMLKLTNLEPR